MMMYVGYFLPLKVIPVSLFDSTRSEREFLYEILGEVIKAGATTLNIPDTVGITVPTEFGQLIADIKANTSGIENVIISTHCQNDLGLSTANTIAVCGCVLTLLNAWGIVMNCNSHLSLFKFRGQLQVLDNWK